MKYIISYDIESDKKRRKASKILEEHGVRIQFSVFECDLTLSSLSKLQVELEKYVDTKSDSLMILPVCQKCYEKKTFIGTEVFINKIDFIAID